MAKTVRLWVREDGEAPKAIALDAVDVPGPGKIVDVVATSATEAREVYATAVAPAPDEDKAPAAWLAHRQAKKRVVEVTRGPG